MGHAENLASGGRGAHLVVRDHQQNHCSIASSSSSTGGASPTLAQFCKRVDVTSSIIRADDGSDSGDGESSPHYTLELGDMSCAAPVSSGSPVPVPFLLKFTDLIYSVKAPKRFSPFRRDPDMSGVSPAETEAFARTKRLLDTVSGEAKEGEILAVLGASGSGKSTLIDALADRIERSSLRGSVTLNGENLQGRMLKVISAYVMQDDLLFPMLTVEETLLFAADFRLPRSLSAAQKKNRVHELIDQLGLRSAAKTIIGDEGHRGVSGGERRRVSIGIDIIHNPILLFLDEPTSGLDATSAFMVVKVLQGIARNGSVVIMSVHQPSYRILGLIDRLIFLSRGQTVYNGPSGDLASFFEDFGSRIPRNENPTEFALDLIRELEGTPTGTKYLVDFNRVRQRSNALGVVTTAEDKLSPLSLKEAISARISRGKLVSGMTDVSSTSSAPTTSVAKFANPFLIETAVLTRRSFTNSRRMPELFAIRLGAVLVTGFILATIFWRLDDTPRGVQERLGFFAFAMSTMFYTCADALPVFLQERYIFLRETAHNAYRHSSYVVANALVAFPPLVLLSIAFTLTTFFAVGLSGGAQGFLFFFLIILASFWAGSGFVTFLSGVVTHIMLGYAVVVSLLAYFLLFSGFFINRDRIHPYWIWFHYISLVKYPYEAVMQNEFHDPARCFVRGVQMFDNSPLAALPEAMKENVLSAMSESLGVNITISTCITTGVGILEQQGITQLSKWNCLWVTVAWGFLFRAFFYVSLLLGSRNKRR